MKKTIFLSILSAVLIIASLVGLYFKVEYSGWILFVGLLGALTVFEGEHEDTDIIKQIAWNEGRNAPRGSANPYSD